MKELISIILPVYNSEKYLKRCIDSIVNQTYQNLEIIIINDGSTDDSLSIIKEFIKQDKRIILIDKKNEGVSKARNIGIEKANGEYITFIDSDDWLEDNAIEILYNELEKNKVDVIRGNYYRNTTELKNDFSGNLYRMENQIYSSKDIKEFVIDHFLLSKESHLNLVMLLLIKKEIIKNIRFDESLYFMEDVIFHLEVFLNSEKIYLISKPIYHYYLNDESATKSYKKYTKNIFGVINANKKISNIIDKFDVNLHNRIKKMNAVHLQVISNYCYFAIKKNVDVKETIIELNKNEHFNYMKKNKDMKALSIKGKVMVFLFNNCFPIFKLISKFMRVIK